VTAFIRGASDTIGPPPRPSLQDRYAEWRSTPDGEEVVEAIRQAALRLRARGFSHYGIAALYEAARYTRALRVGPDAEGFKLNNNWRSRIARELMAQDSSLAGFFEVRDLKA